MTLQDFVDRVGAIGDTPDNTSAERLEHKLLVYMGCLMSVCGFFWGSLAAAFELWIPAVVPYGYVLITVANLVYFRVSKNFETVRLVQVTASFMLPFLFQWSMGGFVDSGAVMLWSMLSIVGSLAFAGTRFSLVLLIAYSVLAVASGLIDSAVRDAFSPSPSEGVQTLYFVTNVVMISGIVFGLTIWLLEMRNRANTGLEEAHVRLRSLNEDLEGEVAARTRELQAALAQSKAILAHMADGLAAVGADGTVQVANPALAAMFQVDSIVPGADQTLPAAVADLAARSAAGLTVVREEIALPGQRIGAAVASALQIGDEGNAGAVVLVRDITLEKEIDRMKTDFIATVSHELRTPLTSVLGFAHVTQEKLEESVLPNVQSDDKRVMRDIRHVRGNIQIMISEGTRLTALINDVLEISKMEAGQVEWNAAWIEPQALVNRAIEATSSLFDTSSVSVEVDVAEGLPAFRGDSDRLMQVLINLLSNAQKFTDEGSVTVSVAQDAHELLFSVVDTGMGIARADLDSVFEKFKQVGETLTNKPKGTGLGLPICKQIIEAHGGVFTLESELGAGSSFRFKLPIGGRPPLHGPDALVRGMSHLLDVAMPQAGRDVLVVDDNANLRTLLRQQLEDRGYHVREAADGPEALDAARARQPDVVVLDVMMPTMSGFDVATVLKADPRTEGVPILILSVVDDPERGYRVGAESYLTKPAEPGAVVREVERLLEASPSIERSVLVVRPDGVDNEQLSSELSANGYRVVGTCAPEEALSCVHRENPHTVLIDGVPDAAELIALLRTDDESRHTYVVQVMSEESL